MRDKNNPKWLKSSRILPIIGMSFGLMVYFSWILAVYIIMNGYMLTRTVLILVLIYQYFFAKKSELYRRFLKYFKPWEIFNKYEVYVEGEIEKDHSLFAFHPHGILGFGASMSGALNEDLYNSIFCGSRAMINMPISGIIARWLGVHGVNHNNFKYLMKKGKNMIFVPGGFEEATITNYGKDRVYIKNRKGFIKYALQFGYKIHPCYTFNENKIFYTVNGFQKFGLFLNKLKLPGILFFSKYLIFPNCDFDLISVIGKPIRFPVIKHPTSEDVNKYHEIYIQELINLYDRYKIKYHSSTELEIF